ncbi:type VI secretion system protein TssA [Acinetobacter sp. ANC 4635]|uniref:type VI secretion system protein TssA n=1 Tax=Acinetobacter sp. ANC 4635 TaxID=2529846 RepID=UPI00103DB5F0|nr:type VI secretion system protein TssA [Acinetobacter sp. ANC 4635]TCB33235.1 type VI secretion system protein TssA [Acinetobacter sp. ANC 4635]
MNIVLSELYQPVTEHALCGEDLSFSTHFHDIKKAKTQDDVLLDQGDWVTERKQADWDFVVAQTIELLREKSKDIRLVTWLTEGWANLYGFQGIAHGIQLCHELLQRYWQQIHPEMDEDDLDQRIGLLQGFIQQLPSLIKSVPLTSGQYNYHLLDYDNALYHENNRRKHSNEEDAAIVGLSLEQFEQALFNTSKSFQYQNYQAFQDILTQWQQLKQILDELMGLDAPSFAIMDSTLDDIHSTLRKVYKTDAFGTIEQSVPVQSEVIVTPTVQVQTAPVQATGFQAQTQNHLANREQAMLVLQDISDYFQANEPHSPVSYMLQKTIKWSQMPLHEWLAQVIKDDQPLQMVQDILGVQPKNEYE